MNYSTIQVKAHNNAIMITLNQPDTNNKLDLVIMNELIRALKQAELEATCSAVILTSIGEYFCGGGNLGDYRSKDSVEIDEFGSVLKTLLCLIRSLSKPVIAVVQGHAFGGGFSLVEACDLAIASEDALFATPEAKHGLGPAIAMVGSMRTLSKKLVMQLALFGDTLTAEEALQKGVINYIYTNNKLIERALELTQKLSRNNPTAVTLCKKFYEQTADMSYEKQVEFAIGMLVKMLKCKDADVAYAKYNENAKTSWSNGIGGE